jgi:general secretion pathway protein E
MAALETLPGAAGECCSDPSQADDALVAALVGRGLVAPGSIERARAAAAQGTEPLHAVLPRLGLVSDRDVASILSELLGLPVAAAAAYPAEPLLAGRLGVRFLRQFAVLPLATEPGRVVMAMADPLDDYARRAVAVATGLDVVPRVAVRSELEAALERLYGETEAANPAGAAEHDEDVDRLRDLASEAPVIRLAGALIDRAAAAGASDIHITPMAHRLSVRFRIDGDLQEIEAPPRALHAALMSRLKLMAGLDIAERRLPQDGRLRVVHAGREIDLRVATTPSLHGEAMVIRLLNRDSVPLDLDRLGLSPAPLAALRGMLAQPNGMVLVTGPTGSGKTTTLYAALHLLNHPRRKLMSVEDPIEYHLDGVTQIQVAPAIGLDFARVLRALLRHNPNILLVGEIRDRETAEIAMQAALTGHLVLSTLHTNGAAATIGRLLEMGIADYLIAATLRGVLAQRLVRTLCACRRTAPGASGAGCTECGFTGFRGRTALAEALVVDEGMRRLILDRAGQDAITEAAARSGTPSLQADGMAKVQAGLISVADVLQVADDG